MKKTKIKNKINYKTCNTEIVCRVCGFVTYSYRDMVEHLADLTYNNKFESRSAYENCNRSNGKILMIKREKENDISRNI